jgi:glycosyltransferase 2 family protein
LINDKQRRHIGTAFFALVLVFLGIYLTRIDFDELAHVTWNWPLMALATFVAMLFRYWGVFVWIVILRGLGCETLPSFGMLSLVYSKAWIGRYIPGKVSWIVGKVYLASKLGIGKTRIAASAVIEAGMQVVALVAAAMLLLGFDPRLNVISFEGKVIMLGLACGCILVLMPPVFNFVVRKAYVIVKRKELDPTIRLSGKVAFKSIQLYWFGAILSGTSFFLLSKAVYPSITFELYLFCVGAYNLAGAVGMITPIVPSGIGVRDGALLAMLTVILPVEIAVVLTVLSRLWAIVVDLLFVGIAHIAVRGRELPIQE